MTVQTTTHLNFRGDARQALEFYQSVFGGNAVINTYADFGMPAELPDADKVVFGLVAAENGFRVMGYDIPGRTEGSIAGGGSTRRENNVTVTDQALFVSIGADSLNELLLGCAGSRGCHRRTAGRISMECRLRDAH